MVWTSSCSTKQAVIGFKCPKKVLKKTRLVKSLNWQINLLQVESASRLLRASSTAKKVIEWYIETRSYYWIKNLMLTCTSPKMTRQDPQFKKISINLSAVIHHRYEEGCQKVYSNGMKQTWVRISLKNGLYMLFDTVTRNKKKNSTYMEAMWLE